MEITQYCFSRHHDLELVDVEDYAGHDAEDVDDVLPPYKRRRDDHWRLATWWAE